MGRVTCLKLAYALGMPVNALLTEFSAECEIASVMDVAQPSMKLRQFHVAMGALHYFPVATVYRCVSKNLRNWIETSLSPMYRDIELLPAVSKGAATTETWVRCIVERLDKISRAVYRELKLSIPYDVFVLLTKYSFSLTERQHITLVAPAYNLSFAAADWMRDDVALCSCLSLKYGKMLPLMRDSTRLQQAVDTYLDDVVMPVTALRGYDSAILFGFDGEDNPQKRRLQLWLKNVIRNVAIFDSTQDLRTVLELARQQHRQVLCVSPVASAIDEAATSVPDVTYCAVTPVAPEYYNKWRRRAVSNVYLLNLNWSC